MRRSVAEQIREPVITGERVRMVCEQVCVPTEIPGVVGWQWITRPESYDEWAARQDEMERIAAQDAELESFGLTD